VTETPVFDELDTLRGLFQEHGAVLAYLFGSHAEGRSGPLSDLDFAVLFGPDVPPEAWSDRQIKLMVRLMDLFGRDDVDLVVLNRATPVMAQQVATRGCLLFEAQPGTRVDFEVDTLRRYVDTKPLRWIQDQYFFLQIERDRALIADR
jgi:hypothetical protein